MIPKLSFGYPYNVFLPVDNDLLRRRTWNTICTSKYVP